MALRVTVGVHALQRRLRLAQLPGNCLQLGVQGVDLLLCVGQLAGLVVDDLLEGAREGVRVCMGARQQSQEGVWVRKGACRWLQVWGWWGGVGRMLKWMWAGWVWLW